MHEYDIRVHFFLYDSLFDGRVNHSNRTLLEQSESDQTLTLRHYIFIINLHVVRLKTSDFLFVYLF